MANFLTRQAQAAHEAFLASVAKGRAIATEQGVKVVQGVSSKYHGSVPVWNIVLLSNGVILSAAFTEEEAFALIASVAEKVTA